MSEASFLIECGGKFGIGRIRRTLTLARALADRGVPCSVYITNDICAPLVENMGFSPLPADTLPYDHDILAVDVGSPSAGAISRLCAQARTSCVVDDLATRPVTCNYIVNPNLYAATLDYGHYHIQGRFDGPEHILVQDDFFALALPQTSREGIMVSFGGTDNGKLAYPIAKYLSAHTAENIYIPLPIGLTPCPALANSSNPRIKILTSPDMPGLLGRVQMYVGSAGATVLEAMAAQSRVCAIGTQADQHLNVAYLRRTGFAAFDTFDVRGACSLALETLAMPLRPSPLVRGSVYAIADALMNPAQDPAR